MADTVDDLLSELNEWLQKARDLTEAGEYAQAMGLVEQSEPVAATALNKLDSEPGAEPLVFKPGQMTLADATYYAKIAYSLSQSAYQEWQHSNPFKYQVRIDLELLIWLLPEYRAALEEAGQGK